MEHHFNIKLAKEYGIECAILIHNLYFWISKNAANNKHSIEGRFWTYNSTRAFAQQFEYLSKSQISRHLKKLSDYDIILVDNFNENKYDRTLWYSFSDNGLSILQSCNYDVTKLKNGCCKIETPIPYSITDSNTDNKKDNTKVLSKKEEFSDYEMLDDGIKKGEEQKEKSCAKREKLQAAEDDFYDSLKPFVTEYGKEMIRAFFDYWTEPNTSLTKLRFQMEKTWDLKKRLDRWRKNNFGASKSPVPKSRVQTNIEAAQAALEILNQNKNK